MRSLIRRNFLVLCLLLIGGNIYAQTADFTASVTEGCVPLLVQFTNTSSGSITSYAWNLGNGVTSTVQNASTTYTTPGTYTVSLTVSGTGGSNTKTITNYITVYAPPVVGFTGSNLTGCVPLNTSFVSGVTPNAPGAVSYSWNFGDGGTSVAPNPGHAYTTVGTFSVTLTATSGKGCVASATQSALVTTNPTPVTNFSTPATVFCKAPATVPFTSSGTSGCTVSWSFGDGGTASGTSTTHTYNATGTYSVRMVAVNSFGCTDTVNRTINVVQTTNTATYTGPANVCEGTTASFANSTTGATLPTAWYFGGTNTASGNTATNTYSTPGTYPVMMVTTTGSCPDTAWGSVTVRPKPVASISMAPAVPCPPPTSVTFLGGSSIGGSTFQWSWSKGGTATGTGVAHTYNTPTIDTAKLVVTSPYGCKDSILYGAITVSDIRLQKTIISNRYGCAPLSVTFNTAIASGAPTWGPYPSAIATASWNFGDGNSGTGLAPAHTYTVPGTYIATVSIVTADGCNFTDTVHIRVGSKVKPAFHVLSDSICFGSHITAINTTASSSGVLFYYTTNVGGMVWAPNSSTDIPVDSVKQFWIILHSINNGCEDTTSLMDSVVVNPPRASFTDSLTCAPGTTVHFFDQSWRATSVAWNFGDGGTSSSFTPVHAYPTRGVYTVRMIAHNSSSGCYDTAYKTISMTGAALSIVSNDTAVCFGDVLHLAGQSSPPAVSSAWAVDNHLQPSFTTPYLDSAMGIGFHTITYIAKDIWGCTDSIRRPNYVIVSKPTAKFGGSPLIGCAPFTMYYTDSSTFTPGTAFGARDWYFGDGVNTAGTVQPQPHVYIATGFYSPILVVRDFNGCADTLTKPNYVEVRNVDAAFSAIKIRGCIGEQLAFTNASTGPGSLNYSWDFGDGDTSTADNPTHAYRAAGSYSIRLIASDPVLGCTDTLVRHAYITITRPTASFTLSDSFSICLPAIIQGQSTSLNATSLLWTFGNGSTSTLPSPVLSYATPGIYNVQLVAVNSDGCADTSPITAVRVLGYNGALTYTPIGGCTPLAVKFKAAISNVPYLVWDFADGTVNTTARDSVTHVYIIPGIYRPRLLFSNSSGCKASSEGLDTIKVDVVKAAYTVNPPCVFSIVELRDTSYSLFTKINSWKWDFGGGAIATGSKTTRSYARAGKYPVKLYVTNAGGCKDSVEGQFDIYPLPKVEASPDTVLCVPDRLILWATGARNYKWLPADSLSCDNCSNPSAGPDVPTTYIVTGVDSNGCANRDSVRIGIQTKTSFNVSAGSEICSGLKVKLVATGATEYHWSPKESLDNPDSDVPVAWPDTTTTYVVTAKEGSCDPSKLTVKIVVNPLPVVDAGADKHIGYGQETTLEATGHDIARIEWDEHPALSCFLCASPVAQPKKTSTFRVTAFSDKNCRATDEVTVYVSCDERQLFVPNTFTPNHDGVNDYFFPRSESIKTVNYIRVFNRWGEMVFERTDYPVNEELTGWDGTFKGNELAPDAYVYLIQTTCADGTKLLWKGDVTLMR